MALGLALSGGGIRCIAQLAVIKCLQEYNLQPQLYVGASAGALAAALVAAGKDPDDIVTKVKEQSLLKLVKLNWNRMGILDVGAALKPLTADLPPRFENLGQPVVIAATNMNTGSCEFFSSGELLPPLLASCCVPVFFEPIQIGSYQYIDAGLTNNFPVNAIWGKCRYLIGVHTNPIDRSFVSTSMKNIFERTFLLSINGNVKPHKKLCNTFLEPDFLKTIKVFDLRRVEEVYERTLHWMRPQMPRLAEEIHQIIS